MITVILGGLAIAAALATFARWDEVVSWLKAFVQTLIGLFTSVAKGIAHAAAVFVEVVTEGMAGVMHKLYFKENGQYIEQVRTRTVPESELPAWAKKKLNKYHETEISNDVERELQLTL